MCILRKGETNSNFEMLPLLPLASSPQPSAKYSLGNQKQLPPSCGRSAPGGDQPRVPNHSAKLNHGFNRLVILMSHFLKYFFGQEKILKKMGHQ